MTVRLKIGPPQSMKLKVGAGFGLPLIGRIGLLFQKTGGIWYGDLDYSRLEEITSFDASQKIFAVVDRATGVWNRISFASLIAAGQTQQVVTDAGGVIVRPNDGLIALNKTVGEATPITLPLASAKVGPVKIADYKGDASTNPITISTSGSDKISGNLSTWVIGADTGSVLLHPIPGGYVV